MDATNPAGNPMTASAIPDGLFRVLFAASPEAVLVTTANGRIVAANPAAARRFGRDAADLAGLPLSALADPERRSWVDAAAESARRGSFEGSGYWLVADGRTQAGAVTVAVLGPEAGGNLGWHLRFDSADARSDEAVRESEASYRGLVEAAFDGCVVHQDGVIISVNAAYAAIFGCTKEELVGQKVLDFVAPEARAVVTEAIVRGEVQPRRATGLRKDGTRVEIESVAHACTVGGRPARIVAIRDLSERNRAETERREAAERYDTIVRSVGAGLMLHQVDGRIVEANPTAERILGRARLELLAMDPVNPQWQGIDVQGRPLAGAEHPVQVALRTGAAVRDFEMGIRRDDGTVVWLSVNAEPVRSADGRVTHAISSFSDITARRAAESEYRRVHEQLRAAVAASRIVWWEWRVADGDFAINACGQPCILGYSHEQLGLINGLGWLEKTHPEDRPMVKKTLDDALAGRVDHWTCEHRMLAADRTWRWVRHVGRVSRRGEDGRPHLMVGTTQDEHAHHEAEHRAQLTAQRLQLALDASRMGVWRYHITSRRRDWDDRMLEIYGISRAELESEHFHFSPLVHPDDREKVKDNFAAVQAGRRNFEYSYRIVRPDGSIRQLRSVGIVQLDAVGRPEWVTGINEDVTSLQMKEMELRDLTERLQLALRASRLGIWEFDLHSGRLQWDDVLLGIFGVAPEQWTGTLGEFRARLHPDDLAQAVADFQQILTGTALDYREYRIYRLSDGAVRTIEANGYLVRDSAGLPARVVGMHRDITEQKEAESNQREMEIRLAQSQRLETIGTLAGGIAHDFNNILAGMMGFVDLALRAVPPGSETAEYLRGARDGGIRARDLVRRLLIFARKGTDTVRQPLYLRQLVGDTISLLRATQPASIEIRTELPEEVGPVIADAAQVQLVLMNLCVNAAQAIGARQGHITLSLRRVEHCPAELDRCPVGPHACLTVTDDGCGMDEATRARIFEPFFSTKAQGEGTGLGLSIVHGIVHDHGGSMRVESAPGRGATFEIFLPLAAAPAPAPVPAAPAPAPTGGGRRVLVADDERPVRMVADVVLRRAGFSVELCVDGTIATERFTADPASYALALVDLSMPGRTGWELINDMRALRPDLPVILMSGDHSRYEPGGKPSVPNLLRLPKPFSIDELLAALRQILGPAGPAK